MRDLRPVFLLLFTLLLGACSPRLEPSSLPRNDDLYSNIDVVREAWENHPDLPSADTDLCDQYLDNASIIRLTEAEFIDQIGLCPMTENGCSDYGPCANILGCVSAAAMILGRSGPRSKALVIFLAPHPGPDGVNWSVRHEGAHGLNQCTRGHMDVKHEDPNIWGSDGVVARPDLYMESTNERTPD